MARKLGHVAVGLALVMGSLATAGAEARIAFNKLAANRLAANRISFNRIAFNHIDANRVAAGSASLRGPGEGSVTRVVAVELPRK